MKKAKIMQNEYIQQLLKDRYFLSTETTWEQLAKRVSLIYPESYEYIRDQIFIPSTPTLLNANTNGERKGTLSSCFTMGIDDSIEGIFDSLKDCAIVTKASGGIGVDFSVLRSSNEIVGTINRRSSGPIPFMRMFNIMLDGIQQGGVRRGAGMAMLDINHPDIIEFIKIKSNPLELNRMNLSIRVNDEFYKKLIADPDAPHKVFNRVNGQFYDLQDNKGNIVSVGKLWKKIMHYAWLTGDPGIFNSTLAYDRCANINLGNIVISNPCAEFVNIFWVSCSLGSFNLLKFVDDNGFNWDAYRKAIQMAVNFLNVVIDKNFYPVKKIEEITLKTRPIGLGIMGFADLLYMLKIPYNSQEAITLGDEIIRYATLVGMQTSVELAKLNGSYQSFDQRVFFNANKRFFDTDVKCRDIDVAILAADIRKYGIRNSAITSIAPTGSISTLCEVSSGIEPVFALSYTRKVEKLNGKYDKMYVVDKVFEKCLDEKYSDKKEKILAEVAENNGSCKDCKMLSVEDRKLFITANDMTVDEHLNILGSMANATSLSISKTVNLPKDAKESDISDVYLKAWKLGIIGLTIYRDGSKEGILTTDSKEERKIDHIVKTHAPKRPQELPCDIHHVKVTKKLDKIRQLEYIVAVGLLYGDPYEIFVFENGKLANKNDTGILVKTARGKYDIVLSNGDRCVDIMKEQTEEEECVTRMASTALRHGADIHFVVHHLEKVKGDILGTFTKVMARVLKKYIKEGVKVTGEVCPECEKKGEKGDLVRKAGCVHCRQCFWSKCG